MWLVRARTFTEPGSPLGSITVPWGQKSSSGTSGFQVATRSDHVCFPWEGPAMPFLGSIFSSCNWVGGPSASLISKMYNSSFHQHPSSSCTLSVTVASFGKLAYFPWWSTHLIVFPILLCPSGSSESNLSSTPVTLAARLESWGGGCWV